MIDRDNTPPSWLENAWYVCAESAELGRSLLHRKIIGQSVLLYRTEAGAPVALADRCPHRLAPLSRGMLEGDAVRCAYHGVKIGPDGACLSVPGGGDIPDNARVRPYPVKEIGPWVWIWMGDAAAADESLIPECRWLTEPGWAVVHGRTPMQADFRLLADNLLDLTHESFLHDTTIGNAEIPDFPIVTEQDGSALKTSRMMTRVEPAPFLKVMGGYEGKIDRWHTVNYAAPAYIWIESGNAETGSNRGAGAMERRGLHALTPEHEHATHYFWALARNFAIDDDSISAYFRSVIVETFDQDVGMIEAQAQNIAEAGLQPPLAKLDIDEAPVRARRILDRLIRQERGDGRPARL